MEFTRRKLPKEATQNLRLCPIESVRPYALMLAPVYVYMRKNEKFVAVKAPLDFFSAEELDRLKPFQSFFLPEFVDFALPFRETGRAVRALLAWKPDPIQVPLAPASFEISDAILRLIGPLWGAGVAIEPFFVAAFVNELCDLFDGTALRSARDLDVKRYERAIFLSSWYVFLALHLGLCSLEHLNRVRLEIFTAVTTGRAPVGVDDEILALAEQSLDASPMRALRGGFFDARDERIAQRIAARLRRVSAAMPDAAPAPTIFGEKGFVDG